MRRKIVRIKKIKNISKEVELLNIGSTGQGIYFLLAGYELNHVQIANVEEIEGLGTCEITYYDTPLGEDDKHICNECGSKYVTGYSVPNMEISETCLFFRTIVRINEVGEPQCDQVIYNPELDSYEIRRIDGPYSVSETLKFLCPDSIDSEDTQRESMLRRRLSSL